ncbi:hypothetical protein WSM22_14500 [Cytophagales bacterium WSM2-2]|nr:hypothetical protein WSM22_14500 [Cytophagales bacterium WSM2-2]
MLGTSLESWGQFNRRTIKRNNKRIASFTGKKHFGKEHVYSGVGFSLNAMNYYGDLAPLPNRFSTDISFTKPGFGISFFHRFGPRYTLVGQFMYGTLKGSDAESAKAGDLGNGIFRSARNLSFRNRIKELSLVAVFDLFENEGTYISRVKWTPYVFIGIAVFMHNPQALAPDKFLDGTPNPKAGQWVDLQPLGTEGQYATLQSSDVNYGIKPYSLTQMAIPFGGGARFRINEVFDLWADVSFRYTFTDYLDDVSRNYVDLGVFKDPLAQAMSYRSNELPPNTYLGTSSYTGRDGKTYTTINGFGSEFRDNNRGNKKSLDVYMVTSVKLTYILGATFHRAKFR